MGAGTLWGMARTVFFEVDTQFDFVFPAGALYVPGAERLLPVIARLNEFAATHGIMVLSTVDAHPENDGEFTEYAAHCVRGTTGQRKPDISKAKRVLGWQPVVTLEEGLKTTTEYFRQKVALTAK